MGAASSLVPADAELEVFNKLKAEYEANKDTMSDGDLFAKLSEMYNAETAAKDEEEAAAAAAEPEATPPAEPTAETPAPEAAPEVAAAAAE